MTLGTLNKPNWLVQYTAPKINVGIATVALRVDGASSSSAAVAYNSVTDTLYADLDATDFSTNNSTVTADTYYAHVHVGADTSTNAFTSTVFADNVASTVSTSFVVAAATVATYSIQAVTGTTVAQDTGLTGANNIKVLEGTKTLSFKFAGYTDANTKSVAIGQGVVGTVTVTDNGLGDTTITTPAATTLAATGVNSRTFTVTSDINGEWSFDITADEADAGDSFTIGMSAEGVAATSKTVTWEAESISLFQGPNKSAMKIANGGSISVNYSIVNQWGQVPAGDYS